MLSASGNCFPNSWKVSLASLARSPPLSVYGAGAAWARTTVSSGCGSGSMCDRLQAPNKAHWKNRTPVGGNSAEADINGSHSGRLSYIISRVRLCYRWLRNLPAGRGPIDSFLRTPRISFVCGVDERSSLAPRILAYRSQRRPDQLVQFTLEG
jgi:hypothetical protein